MLPHSEKGDSIELLTHLLLVQGDNSNSAAHLRYRLANLLSRKEKDVAGAEANYKRTIELAPDFGDAHNALGLLYGSESRKQKNEKAKRDFLVKARDAFAAGITATKRSGCVYFSAVKNLARVEKELGNVKEAEKLFRQLMALDPNNASAFWNLGTLLLQQVSDPSKQKEVVNECVSLFQEAIRVDPMYVDALTSLADVHDNFTVPPNKAMAAACLHAALAIQPTTALHMRIGEYYESELKDYRQAKRHFESAASLQGGNKTSHAAQAVVRVSATMARLFADPKVDFERTPLLCPSGHFLFRVHRKPFLGRGSWACDVCFKALGGEEASKRGVLWCSQDCNSDLCNTCEEMFLKEGGGSMSPRAWFFNGYSISKLTNQMVLDGTVREKGDGSFEYRARGITDASQLFSILCYPSTLTVGGSNAQLSVNAHHILEIQDAVQHRQQELLPKFYGCDRSPNHTVFVTDWVDLSLVEWMKSCGPAHELTARGFLKALLFDVWQLCSAASLLVCDFAPENFGVVVSEHEHGSPLPSLHPRITNWGAIRVLKKEEKVEVDFSLLSRQIELLFKWFVGECDVLTKQATDYIGGLGHCPNSADEFQRIVVAHSYLVEQINLDDSSGVEEIDCYRVRVAAATSSPSLAPLLERFKPNSLRYTEAILKRFPDLAHQWYFRSLLLQRGGSEKREKLLNKLMCLQRALELFEEQHPWCGSEDDFKGTDFYRLCCGATAAARPPWAQHNRDGVELIDIGVTDLKSFVEHLVELLRGPQPKVLQMVEIEGIWAINAMSAIEDLFYNMETEKMCIFYNFPEVEPSNSNHRATKLLSLRKCLKKLRRIPECEATRIVIGIALALDELHERGIVHRNLFPRNIFLVAKHDEEKQLQGSVGVLLGMPKWGSNMFAVSRPSGRVGSSRDIRFLPPEWWTFSEPTAAFDVWSLGCIASLLINGEGGMVDKVCTQSSGGSSFGGWVKPKIPSGLHNKVFEQWFSGCLEPNLRKRTPRVSRGMCSHLLSGIHLKQPSSPTVANPTSPAGSTSDGTPQAVQFLQLLYSLRNADAFESSAGGSDAASVAFSLRDDMAAGDESDDLAMINEAIRAALAISGVKCTDSELAVAQGDITNWVKLFEGSALTQNQMSHIVNALQEKMMARKKETEVIPWVRRSEEQKLLFYVEGYGDVIFYHAVIRLLHKPRMAPVADLSAPPSFNDLWTGFENMKVMLNHNNVCTGADIAKGFKEIALTDEELRRVKLVVVHDNDLQVIPVSKLPGAYYINDSPLHISTYYHRLRYGRAIENYFIPLMAPVAMLKAAPLVPFWFCVEAFGTVAKGFWPKHSCGWRPRETGTQLGEGWVATQRSADPFFTGGNSRRRLSVR